MMVMLGAIQTWCIVGFFILLFLFLSFVFWCGLYSCKSTLQYGASSQCEPRSGTSLKTQGPASS